MNRCLILLCMLVTVTADQVSESECGGEFDIDDTGNMTLSYTGVSLGYLEVCKFRLITQKTGKTICVEPQTFDIGCKTTIEYYQGYLYDMPDEEFTCGQTPPAKWCGTPYGVIQIYFKGTEDTDTSIKLNIYTSTEKTDSSLDDNDFNDWVKNVTETAVTSIYLIIGLIIGGIVLMIVLIIVVVCCCCRRRNTGGGGGVVYRSPEKAVAM